jgi:vitamin B12 transporter
MHSISYAAVAAAAFISFSAVANQEEIVVTATRVERPASDIGQAVTVIDQQALTTRQTETLVDVLRTVPGVSIARNGGLGATASVFIRGAESDHTVTLIDGVKLNDPSAPGGGFNFGNMLVGNISRVEVLRGSQSVVWGSQAIGGVVNLTTAAPTAEFTAAGRVEYGANDTRQVVASASQKVGRVAASAGISDFSTDGISAFSKKRGGNEVDAFRNFGAHAKFNIELSDAVSLDLRGWLSRSKAGIDGFAPPTYAFGDTFEFARVREAVGYSGLNFALFDGHLRNRLAFAYTETQRGNFDPDGIPVQTFDSAGENARLEYQGIYDFSDKLQATFGLESETSKFITASFGGPATRAESQIRSGYAQFVGKPLEGLAVIVGARRDDHDEFGGNTSLGGSVAWSPNNGVTRLRASYSEGFKAPSLYQLHGDYGNLLLRPETARSGDMGVTQRFLADKVEIGVTYFHRDTQDLIDFISCGLPLTGICSGRPYGTYDNVARTRARGVETTLALRPIAGLSVLANYTTVDAENRSPGSVNLGNALARRPRETSSAVIDYHWDFGVDTGVTYTRTGRSFDSASNTQVVEGYELIDLRVAFQLSAKLFLQARVENLLDEDYETIYRYGTAGRSAYVGLRLNY